MPREKARRRPAKVSPELIPDLQFDPLETRFLGELSKFGQYAKDIARSKELQYGETRTSESDTRSSLIRILNLKHRLDARTGNVYTLTETFLLELLTEAFIAGGGLVADIIAESHGTSRKAFTKQSDFVKFLKDLTELAARDRRTMRGKKISRERQDQYDRMDRIVAQQEITNFEQASGKMPENKKWSDKERKNFVRAYRFYKFNQGRRP
jgi:hypothetical protein